MYSNGTIVQFVNIQPKLTWIEKIFPFFKKEKKYYLCSYINQGEIKHEYELKNGDIFIVRVFIGGVIGLEFLKPKISDDLYFTFVSSNKFRTINKSEADRIIRKEKLKKIIHE